MDLQLRTQPLNAWVRDACWPRLRLIKLSERSMFNQHFAMAKRGISTKTASVIFCDGNPIALAIYDYRDGAIDFQVCVRPDHRRMGLGSFLLRHVALKHHDQGIRVYPHDEVSDDFYASHGLEPSERFRYSDVILASTILDAHR